MSSALPAALRACGVDVKILLPGYPRALAGAAGALEAARVREIGFDARILDSGAFLLLDCPALYRREGGPYQDAGNRDWPDNALRFGLLSKVAARLGGAGSPLAWPASRTDKAMDVHVLPVDWSSHREPLRRVHECVFGVLALESEPVDPRL